QKLLHQIGGARAFRAGPDRGALEVLEGAERPPAPGEQEERLWARQPPEGLDACVGGNRNSVLHESEGGNAAPLFAGEARDILDRSRGGDDLQMAVLLQRQRGKPLTDRVIAAGRRSGQDGSAQKCVVAGDEGVEKPGGKNEKGERDRQDPGPRLFIAARSERQLIKEAHASAPGARARNRESAQAPDIRWAGGLAQGRQRPAGAPGRSRRSAAKKQNVGSGLPPAPRSGML